MKYFNGYPKNREFASSRYRRIYVERHLLFSGFFSVNDPLEADILIITKNSLDKIVPGKINIYDACDNPFEGLTEIKNFRNFVSKFDGFIFNTDRLKEIFYEKLGDSFFNNKRTHVVPDPVGFEFCSSHQSRSFEAICASGTLRLGWFGHQCNWRYVQVDKMIGAFERFLTSESAFELGIKKLEFVRFTGPIAKVDCSNDSINFLDMVFSPDDYDLFFEAIDMVVLPLELSDETDYKSANRLLECLARGVPVLASPVPSYNEFSGFARLEAEIASVFEQFVVALPFWRRRAEAGSEFVRGLFSPESIAKSWIEALRDFSTYNCAGCNADDSPLVKLNLGCGPVHLDGYVNVDVVNPEQHKNPDLIADIRHLDMISDNSVDEILSVHVIEHFYLWELPSLLEEWRRVLKPGGKLVLETPDLLEACRQVLANPEAVDGGAASQRTMWVLYGDPKHKEPLMCHRWLFSPQSLIRTLEQNGFVDACETVAQFKLGPPRDIRIEARKGRVK